MRRIVTRPYSFRTSEILRQSGFHPVLARLFAARGLQDASEASTEANALIPPSALSQADRAAHFLADAISANKKLLIVADYDCDGATACAVGIRGLRALGANVDYIVPNRFEYGYGLSPEIVALAADTKSPDVIITVDNGIASLDGVAEAERRGIDVVITDHHLPGDKLPSARAIVNPNQPGCEFPSKHLAGVGVMFYVLLALRAEMRNRGIFDAASQPRLDSLLDLVALGTVADVVQLDANNRILVAQGLKRMRNGRMQAGIAALFRVSGREVRAASASDLGFLIGPRVNAAGRMADMSLGIECLITDDEGKAWDIARQLSEINLARREKELEMQDSAQATLEDIEVTNQTTLCLFDEDWHQGIVGLLASRLKDRFYRPTITFAPADDGVIRGSGRSIPGFHLRDALDMISKHAPNLIEKFGGHAMAAGLTIRAEALDAFTEAFEKVGRAWLSDSQLEQIIETDGSLEDSFFNLDFIALLEKQVWGHGFAPPLFADEFSIVNQRIVKERHLKLTLERNGRQHDAIWFGRAESLPDKATFAYRLDANEFNGRTNVQLIVEHAEPCTK